MPSTGAVADVRYLNRTYRLLPTTHAGGLAQRRDEPYLDEELHFVRLAVTSAARTKAPPLPSRLATRRLRLRRSASISPDRGKMLGGAEPD